MMRHGNDGDLILEFLHDNVVSEAFETGSFGSLVACRARQSGERKDFAFEMIERGIDRVIEFQAQARMDALSRTRLPLRWLLRRRVQGCAPGSLALAETLLHAAAEFGAIDERRGAGIDLGKMVQDSLIPGFGGVRIGGRRFGYYLH